MDTCWWSKRPPKSVRFGCNSGNLGPRFTELARAGPTLDTCWPTSVNFGRIGRPEITPNMLFGCKIRACILQLLCGGLSVGESPGEHPSRGCSRGPRRASQHFGGICRSVEIQVPRRAFRRQMSGKHNTRVQHIHYVGSPKDADIRPSRLSRCCRQGDSGDRIDRSGCPGPGSVGMHASFRARTLPPLTSRIHSRCARTGPNLAEASRPKFGRTWPSFGRL